MVGNLKKIIIAILLALALALIIPNGSALEPTTIDMTLDPGEKDGAPIIFFDTDSVDIKITSDEPVDVYIIKNTNVTFPFLESDDFEYEKKWEDQTSLNINYVVEDMETPYYLMVENPSETETANVELEYKLYEEFAGELVEDAAENICCGSTLIAGLVIVTALVILGAYVKRKN